jgi:hypothetical protein
MSSRSFHSLFMVASCAGAALGCYLVSLRVASERASLENVETQIVFAQRDLRVLQTEIGTRGRLAQLERWNVKVLALSAPSADQFLSGSYELAKLAQPEHEVHFDAPVVLASAPQPKPQQAPIGQSDVDDSGVSPSLPAGAMLHEASLKTETREVPVKSAAAEPQTTVRKSSERPVTAASPVAKKSVDKLGLAAAKPVTKPVRLAKNDPLAPLADKRSAKTSRDHP